MRTASLRAHRAARGSLAAAAVALPAAARPTYFQVLTAKYGFVEGDRLYARGVCHYRWEGTGARNLFGSTVEQELYNGKPISAAIDAAVPLDPDEDGFTSLEELTVHETLPGFSCDNFFESIDPPPDWHTFITPFVPSCLEPKDIRANPVQVVFQTDARSTESQTVTIFNNGKDDPIEVTSMSSGPARTPRSRSRASRALHPRGRRDRGARRDVRAHRAVLPRPRRSRSRATTLTSRRAPRLTAIGRAAPGSS